MLAFYDFLSFQTFRLMDFLFVFTFGVYGAELIARSAHFPTIHLTFLDSKSFSATLSWKEKEGNLATPLAWFSLFNKRCHLAFPQFSEDQKKADFSPIQIGSQRVISFHFLHFTPSIPYFKERVVVKSKGALDPTLSM